MAIEAALDTYKAIRKRFYEAADIVFGPGFLSMTEYYFMKKNGHGPIAMLFSEPRFVYDEWVTLFRGEEAVRMLVEQVVGPGYVTVLENIKRNDGLKVWSALGRLSLPRSIAE